MPETAHVYVPKMPAGSAPGYTPQIQETAPQIPESALAWLHLSKIRKELLATPL
jgi:hypothetical protein